MRRRSVLGLATGLILLLAMDGSATSDGMPGAVSASFAGAVRLQSQDPRFGGFSAIDLQGDGGRMMAISDRSTYVTGRIERDAQGRLVSVRLGPVATLRGTKADEMVERQADSEAMATAPDGWMFVAFEGVARVAGYSAPDARPVDLPDNAAFAFRHENTGLEALAIDAEGTLYAVPEQIDGSTIQVHPFRGGAWRSPFSVPRIGTFRPVSADVGPDGRLYLLERRFEALGGFASRLRRFDIGPDGLSAEVTLLQTRSGRHDNLEGLSVWRAPDGLRATMISDDNFFALQVTELVEYRLPD